MSSTPLSQQNSESTSVVIERFNEAFNRQDADLLASLLTDDAVFEDTSPAPDGKRVVGKTDVAAYWRGWFARNLDAQFTTEEMIVTGERAIVRWVYHKLRHGQPWHLRGVDCGTGKWQPNSLT